MDQYNQDQAARDSDLFDMGLSLDDYDMFADQTSIGEPGEGYEFVDQDFKGYIHTGDDPYGVKGTIEKYGEPLDNRYKDVEDFDASRLTKPTSSYFTTKNIDITPPAAKGYTPLDNRFSLFDKATNLVTTKFDKAWNTIQNPFADPKSTAQLSLSAAGFLGVPYTTPISMGLEVLNIMMSEGMGQIGRTGMDMNEYWNPGSSSLGPATMTSVHGFNSDGIAVDIDGNPVGEYNPNDPTRHGLQMFGFPTKAGIEAENRANQKGQTVVSIPDSGGPTQDDTGGGLGSGDDIGDVTDETSGDVAGI